MNMSHEEEKVLKDLVTQSLAAKGFLGKIQAEIRAGVFVALEEQDVLKDIFINKPLKEFIETSNGVLVISLVREFLEFFNLQFTNMVFDPETHAGIDYKFEGRKKLATHLNLPYDQENANIPLLGLLLQSLDPVKKKGPNTDSLDDSNNFTNIDNKSKEKETINFYEDRNSNDDLNLLAQMASEKHSTHLNMDLESNRSPSKEVEVIEDKKENSVDELSSKNEAFIQEDNLSTKIDMKQLNELLHFEPDGGDTNYEEDFISSGSDKKEKTDSTESEIDEELPNSNHSNDDDVTADLTVSNESGQGDYTERISNC